MTDQEQTSTALELDKAVQKALELQRQGRAEEAIKAYQQVLKQNPDHPDALHYLGMACHAHGDHERSIQLIHHALTIAPDYVDALNNLGVIFQTMGRMEEAEHCYRKVIEIRPEHSDSHSNLGIVLKNQDKLSDAGDSFQRALALDPNHARAHHNLGNLYRRAGHLEEAVTHFRKAINAGLESVEARQALINAQNIAGNREGALKSLDEWLKIEPDHPIALHMQAAFQEGQTPARASDEYVSTVFDGMANSFDSHLGSIGYRAPELVAAALHSALDADAKSLSILDAGCGTGLCGPLVKSIAKKLVGVDLSIEMLRRADAIKFYDDLYQGELTEFLQHTPDSWDAIICADTLCYFGDLGEVSKAAASSVKGGGVYVFTVEHLDDESKGGYLLQENGRYSHNLSYVRSVLDEAGLTVSAIDKEVLRRESGKDVHGLIVSAVLSKN